MANKQTKRLEADEPHASNKAFCLDIGCDCGNVLAKARVVDGTYVRVICHCRDCRAWLEHLGRLDEDGVGPEHASDIIQMPLASLTLKAGPGQFDCKSIAGKGLMRWSCVSCRAPVLNAATTDKVPIVGVYAGRATVAKAAASEHIGLRPPAFDLSLKNKARKLTSGRPLGYAVAACRLLIKARRLKGSDLHKNGKPLREVDRVT